MRGVARWTVVVMWLLGARAWAEDFSELAALELPAPEPGVDTARPVEPTWCAGLETSGASPASLRRGLEAGQRDWRSFLGAVVTSCQWPKEPAVQRAAAVITQHWMNFTGLPQGEAMWVLGQRARRDAFEAARERLCDALTVSEEVEGEEKAFMHARRTLFGCSGDAMWLSDQTLGGPFSSPVLAFLDASATPADQAVLIAQVLDGTRFLFEEKTDRFEASLARWVLDQVDVAELSDAKVRELLDAPPYRGNDYAKAVLLESSGRARLAGARYQAAVAARVKDAAWKEFLVTAPARGLAEWKKVASANEEELARSHAFEARFFGPSRSAVKGCWPTLKADFVKVLRALPHATEYELCASLNEPLPALLLSRLAACAAVDADPAYATRLVSTLKDVRPARGPRSAAYYVALAALGPIVADRPKFPVKPQDLFYAGGQALLEATEQLISEKQGASKIDAMGWVGDGGEGTIQAVKKSGATAVVSFVPTKGQVMSHACQTTNRIERITADGELVYQRLCRETGWVTVDTTPAAFTAPAEWVEGLQAGSVLRFDAARGKPPARIGLPIAGYADKSKKRLTNFLGFAL